MSYANRGGSHTPTAKITTKSNEAAKMNVPFWVVVSIVFLMFTPSWGRFPI